MSPRQMCIRDRNYGGRDEIRRAVQAISEKVQCGELAPEDITDEMISDELTTGKLHALNFGRIVRLTIIFSVWATAPAFCSIKMIVPLISP